MFRVMLVYPLPAEPGRVELEWIDLRAPLPPGTHLEVGNLTFVIDHYRTRVTGRIAAEVWAVLRRP